MPIVRQDKRKAKIAKKQSGWDMGIADAKRKIKQLHFTIRVYTENKKRGEPWPGDLTTHN